MNPLAFGRYPLVAALLAVALFFTGCGSSPLLDRVVSAESAQDFSSWQMRNRDAFTPEQWTEFEAILQDLKLKIITLEKVSGSDAVNDALRPKIHGRTVREVMRLGYEDRLWRLNVQRTEIEKMIEANAGFKTRPGADEAAAVLARKRGEQASLLAKTQDEIKAAEAKRDALGAPAAK